MTTRQASTHADIASRLRTLLKGRSKTEIATKMGVTRQTVYDWERRGTITDENLFRLCAWLGVDPFEIKYDTNYKQVGIDYRALKSIVQGVERYLTDTEQARFSPEDYAQLIVSFYEIYNGQPEIDERTIFFAMKAALSIHRMK